jgi:hypothetical protein
MRVWVCEVGKIPIVNSLRKMENNNRGCDSKGYGGNGITKQREGSVYSGTKSPYVLFVSESPYFYYTGHTIKSIQSSGM